MLLNMNYVVPEALPRQDHAVPCLLRRKSISGLSVGFCQLEVTERSENFMKYSKWSSAFMFLEAEEILKEMDVCVLPRFR
jgi:hypothetical protein